MVAVLPSPSLPTQCPSPPHPRYRAGATPCLRWPPQSIDCPGAAGQRGLPRSPTAPSESRSARPGRKAGHAYAAQTRPLLPCFRFLIPRPRRRPPKAQAPASSLLRLSIPSRSFVDIRFSRTRAVRILRSTSGTGQIPRPEFGLSGRVDRSVPRRSSR